MADLHQGKKEPLKKPVQSEREPIKKTTIRLRMSLWKQLKVEAIHSGKSGEDIISLALEKYLAKNERVA